MKINPVLILGIVVLGVVAFFYFRPSTGPTAIGEGVKIEEIKVGTGETAENRKMLTVHYTGQLTDGKVFDSSVTRNQPFQFILGGGQVIRGWEVGLQGMKVGGKRKITIPAKLGYGDRGSPPVIPPKSDLIFEIELLDVKNM